MTFTKLDSYRPGRNFIRVNDVVKCRPHVGRPFKAQVLQIWQNDETGAVEFHVVRLGAYRMIRVFSSERISRVAQSRVEVKK
jgi:hypothetical protein